MRQFISQICVVLESEVDSSSLDNPRSEFTSRNTKRHINLGLHYIKTHTVRNGIKSKMISIYTMVVYRQDPAVLC